MPYIGLRPFEERDERLFFGREEQVNTALRQLEDHAFLAVVGASGSGKSSIVRAGLLPAIRQGFLLGSQDWLIAVLRPGHEPYERLAAKLASALRPRGSGVPADGPEAPGVAPAALLTALRHGDDGLALALAAGGVPHRTRVLIVVDQFEELFGFRRQRAQGTEVAARDEAAGFVRLLLRGCAADPDRVRVVITMRSDFIGDAEAFLGLPEAISRSQFLVPRLARHQMEEAIVRPASVASAVYQPFGFEPNLVNRIINDAGDRSDQLPLMQHALMRTWKLAVERTRIEGGALVLRHADYEAAGGIEKAISKHADAAWEKLERETTLASAGRRLLLLLCDVSPDGQITRRRPYVEEVRQLTGATLDDVRTILHIFQEDDRNFLLPPAAEATADDVKLDISHESLIRQWKQFHAWVQEENTSASTLTRLRESAQRWPDREPLLRDPALTLALDWVREQSPTDAWAGRYGGGLGRVLQFLAASADARRLEIETADAAQRRELEEAQQRAAEQAANAQRFRWATAVLTTLIVVVIALGVYSFRQHNVVETLSQNVQGLETKRSDLEDDIKGLNTAREQLTKDQEEREGALKTLGELAQGLEAEQKRLLQYNTALAEVAGAHGLVVPTQDGAVAVRFTESDASPDAALPLLSRVGRVTSLDLSRTRVTDAGLRSLRQLRDLGSVNLSYTDITDAGVARLADLKGLRELSLNDTRMTASSLSQLATLRNLTSLDISRTRVNGPAVERLRAALPRADIRYTPDVFLDALSASGGDVDKALAAAQGRRSGRVVSFFRSDITDAALKFLDGFETIELQYCRNITNAGVRILSALKGLKALRLLKDRQITDEGVETLHVPGLTRLELEHLALTDRSLKAIGRMTSLEVLRITGTDHEISDDGVASLRSLRSLKEISLEFGSQTTAKTIEVLSTLGTLEKVTLKSHPNIPGRAYGALKSLPRLRELDIAYSQVGDGDTEALGGLGHLWSLNLTGSQLTESGLEALEKALPRVDIETEEAFARATPILSEEQRAQLQTMRTLPTEDRLVTDGATANGELHPTPALAGTPVQAWSLRGCEKRWVKIDLKSSAFDPALAVIAVASTSIYVDDDGGGSLDARLEFLCEDPEYKVVVTSVDGDIGRFTLSAMFSDNPSAGGAGSKSALEVLDLDAEELTKTVGLIREMPTENRVLAGESEATGKLLEAPTLNDKPAQAWILRGCEGRRVRIDLESDDFDPLLIVASLKSPFIEANDDNREHLNSRLTFLCVESEYRLVVSTTNTRVGAFRLSAIVRLPEPSPAPDGRFSRDAAVQPHRAPGVRVPY